MQWICLKGKKWTDYKYPLWVVHWLAVLARLVQARTAGLDLIVLATGSSVRISFWCTCSPCVKKYFSLGGSSEVLKHYRCPPNTTGVPVRQKRKKIF